MDFSSLLPGPIRMVEHRRVLGNVSDAGFLGSARHCAEQTCSAVLLSGGPVAAESRYSLAAWDPLLVLQSKGRLCTMRSQRGCITCSEDPFAVLDEFFSVLQPDFDLVRPPFAGGAIGYLAYDLKNVIETLPQTARDDLNLPDMHLFWPRQMLIHDRLTGDLHALKLGTADAEPQAMFPNPVRSERAVGPLRAGALSSNFSRENYAEAVDKVRRYIRQGDVYQVNLSQRYQFPLHGSAFQLWETLYQANPAPFYAFVNAGDHQVLSTSMERLLHRLGDRIETRPIKGTRRRGQTPQEDRKLMAELQASPKDDAELSMIVDLLRNDLGRVCLPRTIRVAEHKRLETYQNVHHLVSIVTGQLPETIHPGELLRATFPGGSITGCPKIRAMEIIDELEPTTRHVYTGAIGYLGWHRNLDLNVAIRTALIHNQTCCFSVGGGIVYDSDPQEEYQETLDKGRTLFQVIAQAGENTVRRVAS